MSIGAGAQTGAWGAQPDAYPPPGGRRAPHPRIAGGSSTPVGVSRVPTLAEIAWMLTASRGGQAGAAPDGILEGLARYHGRKVARGLRRELDRIADRLARPEVTIVFGGHFSSGKSTLINALIGRDLLPTSDYPETGVACWISAGTGERARAVTDGGFVDLPFGTEAIAEQVTLIGADGDYRSRVGQVQRVEVTLGGTALPPSVTWVDSPGINDTAAMTERATAAARAADVLIWVVNSRQAMSEVEQAFLREHIAERGAAGVAFVVNAFLPTDTAESWDWFMTQRAPYFRTRVASTAEFGGTGTAADSTAGGHGVGAVAREPAPVVFMSARAGGVDHAGFGVEQVRRLLAGFARDGSPRVRVARLQRAAAGLRAVVADLDRRATGERAALARADADVAAARRDVADRRARFEREARNAVASVFARYRAPADGAVTEVVASIGTGSLSRDNTYGWAMTGKLRNVASRLVADAVAEVTQAAARHGQSPPSPQAVAQAQALLQPPVLTVVVPGPPGGGTGEEVIAAVGQAVGRWISPSAGVKARLWARELVNGLTPPTALERDRAGAQANARACGTRTVEDMTGRQAKVEQLLRDGCVDAHPPPSDPDRTRLAVLEQVGQYFADGPLAAMDHAAAAAHREITT